MSDQSNQTPVKHKVMFVDDDKFLLDMYSLKFSKAGYEVKAMDSTVSALKMIRDGYVPEVMLVDIVMPDMDGLEFVAALRKERLAPNAKIIMFSNQGGSEDVDRARKLNVDKYIVKATAIPSEVLKEVDGILQVQS